MVISNILFGENINAKDTTTSKKKFTFVEILLTKISENVNTLLERDTKNENKTKSERQRLLLMTIFASLHLQGCINLGGSTKMNYSPKPITASQMEDWPEQRSGISIITYNIKHFGWPIASGRSKTAIDIGHILGEMRDKDIQPNVVLLQEAFGKGVENINREAQYPYIVYGPDKTPKPETYPISEEFHRERSWKKGEKSKNILNSGLALLSDYPIISVKRIAFPRGMCAGYDCLASKGVLIAWIQIPEADEPIAFVLTHLNSRGSTGVSRERGDEAYYHQVKTLQKVIKTEIKDDTIIVMGGDFNIGNVPKRLEAVHKYINPLGYENMIHKAYLEGMVANGSVTHIEGVLKDNKDILLVKNISDGNLRPHNAWVPFPKHIPDPYSDHAGVIIDLSLAENEDIAQTGE